MKDFMKVNTLKFLLYIAFVVVIVIPWWKLVGAL